MNPSRRLFLIYIFLFFQTFLAYSQNEIQFKALLKGYEKPTDSYKVQNKKLIRANSDYYKIDLNNDGFFEGLVVEESDMGSSIHFYKNRYEHFQEVKISSGGAFSKVDKIELRKMSKTDHLLLIYFSEGIVKYLKTRSRYRLYVIHIPEKLFKRPFLLSEGPIIFEEFEENGHYHVNVKDVIVEDLNADGINEIVIKKNKFEKVMMFNVKDQKMKLL